MQKDVQITAQLHSSHNASKVMLKILQANFQQYVKCELPDVHTGKATIIILTSWSCGEEKNNTEMKSLLKQKKFQWKPGRGDFIWI